VQSHRLEVGAAAGNLMLLCPELAMLWSCSSSNKLLADAGRRCSMLHGSFADGELSDLSQADVIYSSSICFDDVSFVPGCSLGYADIDAAGPDRFSRSSCT